MKHICFDLVTKYYMCLYTICYNMYVYVFNKGNLYIIRDIKFRLMLFNLIQRRFQNIMCMFQNNKILYKKYNKTNIHHV